MSVVITEVKHATRSAQFQARFCICYKIFVERYSLRKSSEESIVSPVDPQREPDQEEQPDSNMPPKFKRHLNDDEVTGSIRSERVREQVDQVTCGGLAGRRSFGGRL